MGKRLVHVDVHEWDESFSAPVVDFIAQLQDLLETVPAEFRAGVRFEFDRYGGDYDSSAGEMSLWFEREETDDELKERLQHDEMSRIYAERQERKVFERLKAKYEPDR